MQYLGSVQNLILISSWFPHRFESENHAIPWFCPKLDFYNWGNYPPGYGVGPWFKGTRSSAKPLEPSVLLTLQSAAPSEET